MYSTGNATQGSVMIYMGRKSKKRGIYVADSLLKTLMLGKIEGKRRRGLRRIRWLGSITNSMGMKLSKLWEIVKDRGAWWVTILGVTERWT